MQINLENTDFKNRRLDINIDDITESVNVSIMMEVSGLFLRRYIKEQNKNPNSNSINFSDIKYKGPLVFQFLKVCQGQSADIKLSDIYYMLLISEEWESPEIAHQLAMFLESRADPNDLLSRFSTFVKLQQDVSTFLIDIIASKFKDIYNSEKFIALPPKYICSIINNPNCQMPPRDSFEKRIVEIVEKHKIHCSSLVKYIDLLNTDEKNLDALNDDYLSAMYPNINRIRQLRRCKSENDQLKNENEDLKRQLKVLNILKKENEDLKRKLKNIEEQTDENNNE